MQSKAITVEEYIEDLPVERKAAIIQLRKVIKKNLPKGFKEIMSSGMIAYIVPLSLFPAGYHCTPGQALPFMNLASQKNFIVLHHLGLYADPKLLDWFTNSYAKAVSTKLDMGKGCVRFKKMEHIPYQLIGELAAKMSPQDWIKLYEKNFKR